MQSSEWIINLFEEEQKTVVFTALSAYYNTGIFADVTLSCRNQNLRAHKVVLSASSKFFSDMFKHNIAVSVIDLDKELAPNGLELSYEDVQLIIGILYSVGTVEIYPQRIESLLLIAQVLGIPSLISLLKRIKGSLESMDNVLTNISLSLKQSDDSGVFPPSYPSFGEDFSPSLRTNTNTASNTANTDRKEGSCPVLDPYDPSLFLHQLNNLGANQIDDLESALLPHLTCGFRSSVNHSSTSSPFLDVIDNGENGDRDKSNNENNEHQNDKDDDDDDDEKETSKSSSFSLAKLIGERTENQNKSSSSSDFRSDLPNSSSSYSLRESSTDFYRESEQDVKDIQRVLPPTTLTTTEPSSSVYEESTFQRTFPSPILEENNEIRLILNENINETPENSKGKSFKFALPGSGSVKLNFSAEALAEMRNSYLNRKNQKERKNDVGTKTSSRIPFKQRRHHHHHHKESRTSSSLKNISCHLCNASFSSMKLLERHSTFHVEKNSNCEICGKLFFKKWSLDQHYVLDHGKEDSVTCQDCGKVFRWSRNLLAHVYLLHQKEIRYRCRHCPLTFLKKTIYIKHHKGKHSNKPETWCKLCMEVFENNKVLEDHNCSKIEKCANVVICHMNHDNFKPLKFSNFKDLSLHLKNSHPSENLDSKLKISCPVCQKKFLLKKNLLIHCRRYHEERDKTDKAFSCSFCDKNFMYDADRISHENTHGANTQYTCHCNRNYSSQKALLTHQKLIHKKEISEHICDVCGKKLSNKYKLKYHMMVHSDKKHFTCSDCGIQFKGRDNLLRHVKKKKTKTKNLKESQKKIESDSENSKNE